MTSLSVSEAFNNRRKLESQRDRIAQLEIDCGVARSENLKLRLAMTHALLAFKAGTLTAEICDALLKRFGDVAPARSGSLPKVELVVDNTRNAK